MPSDDDFLDSLGDSPSPLDDILDDIKDAVITDIEPDEITIYDLLPIFDRKRGSVTRIMDEKVEKGEYTVRKAWHPERRRVVNAYKKVMTDL